MFVGLRGGSGPSWAASLWEGTGWEGPSPAPTKFVPALEMGELHLGVSAAVCNWRGPSPFPEEEGPGSRFLKGGGGGRRPFSAKHDDDPEVQHFIYPGCFAVQLLLQASCPVIQDRLNTRAELFSDK